MNYKLNLGAWRSVFAVPACAADFLKTASGSQVKVLLYILRNADYACPAENIARAVGISESEVDDAVLFWTNVGVLSGADGEYYPSDAARPVQPAQPMQPVPAISAEPVPDKELSDRAAEVRAAVRAEPQFPPKEIAEAVTNDKAVKYLFETYERLSGKPTRHAERNALMVIIEDIGLPCEVAVMLVEYCFSVEKATPVYMRTVAEDWWKNGIDTISKAEERIKTLKKSRTLESRLRKKFDLSSAFSAKQKASIEEWADYGFSDEMFDEAYDITLKNTGKFSFAYFDKIIRAWHSDGITEVSQIKKKSAAQASEAPMSSFDVSDISEWSVKKYSNLHKKGGDNE